MRIKLYKPIVGGEKLTMVSLSGLSLEQTEDYCKSIFGNRFQGMSV